MNVVSVKQGIGKENMADSYLQFSFEVPLSTPAIKTWASDFLSYPEKHGKFGEETEFVGFEWDTWTDSIHIWAYDNGDTEDVITFLTELIKQPNYGERKLGFSYAYTCSKPRIGEFGGGAVRLKTTQEGVDIEYMDTEVWLTE